MKKHRGIKQILILGLCVLLLAGAFPQLVLAGSENADGGSPPARTDTQPGAGNTDGEPEQTPPAAADYTLRFTLPDGGQSFETRAEDGGLDYDAGSLQAFVDENLAGRQFAGQWRVVSSADPAYAAGAEVPAPQSGGQIAGDITLEAVLTDAPGQPQAAGRADASQQPLSGPSPQGDEDIKIALKWLEAGAFTHANNLDSLSITPTKASNSITLQMDITIPATGDTGAYGPGELEIRMPRRPLVQRDGVLYELTPNYKGQSTTYDINLPFAPNTDNATYFNVREDEATDELVITNHKAVSKHILLEIKLTYVVREKLMHNGYVNGDTAAFTYPADPAMDAAYLAKLDAANGQSLEARVLDLRGGADPATAQPVAESNRLNLMVNTFVQLKSVTKSTVGDPKYESWQSAWGPEPANSEEYIYIVWRIGISLTATQPYVLKVTDNITGDAAYEVVGFSTYGSNYTPGNGANANEWVLDNRDWSGNSNTSPQYVLTRHKRDELLATTESAKIVNRLNVELEGVEYSADSKSAAYSYTYQEIQPFDPPGDTYSAFKLKGNASDDTSFGLDMLEAGASPVVEYTNGALVHGYRATYDPAKHVNGEPASGYGERPYNPEFIDDILYLGSTRLGIGDYSIDSVRFDRYMLYDYKKNDNGVCTRVVDQNRTGYEPVQVYYYTADTYNGGNITWLPLGELFYAGSEGGGEQLSLRYGDGTTVRAYDYIDLPEGACGIKLNMGDDFKRAGVDFSSHRLRVAVHPTQRVLDAIENHGAVDLANVNTLRVLDYQGKPIITAGAWQESGSAVPNALRDEIIADDTLKYDDPPAANRPSHRSAAQTMKRLEAPKSYMGKMGREQDNPGAEYANIRYTLYSFEAMGALPEELHEVAKTKMNEQRKAVFYDLLPMGAYLDESSAVKVYTATSDQAVPGCNYSYEQVYNWQGSGRTMLIIRVESAGAAGENFDNFYFSINYSLAQYFASGFWAEFQVIYPYDSMREFGYQPQNIAAYQNLDGEIAGGRPDDGGDRTNWSADEKAWMTGLDGLEGAAQTNNTLYGECKQYFTSKSAAQASYGKGVRPATGYAFKDEENVVETEDYYYRMRLINSSATETKDIVLFDFLENAYGANPHWRGAFNEVNLMPAVVKGADPVVYYTTATVAQEDEAAHCTADALTAPGGIWTTEMPDDKSTITSIAVDLRRAQGGGEFVLGTSAIVSVEISMTSPFRQPGMAPSAYNRSWIQQRMRETANDWATTELKTVPSAVTKINLLPGVNTLEIAKTSPGDTSYFDFTVELEWDGHTRYPGHEFTYGTYNFKKQFDADGKATVTFSMRGGNTSYLRNLPYGVRYKVTEKDYTDTRRTTVTHNGAPARNGCEGVIAKGTAERVDFTNTRLQSSDYKEITVKKLWKDGADTGLYDHYGDTVEVEVYAEYQGGGAPELVKTATLNYFSSFQTTLKVYNLDEHGNPIRYTVREKDVPGYVGAVSGEVGDGTGPFTVTLENTPAAGALEVAKEVTGIGDTAKDFAFRAEFERTAARVHKTFQYRVDGGAPVDIRLDGSGKLVFDFTLRHGQKIVFTNLPEDTRYTETETDYSGEDYITTVKKNGVDSHNGCTGTVARDETDAIAFRNHMADPYNPPPPAYKHIEVTKVWDDGGANHSADHVQAELYAQYATSPAPVKIATATLNNGNGWKHTFPDLAVNDAGDNPIRYTVKEVSVPGYESKITGGTEGGEGTYPVTITNTPMQTFSLTKRETGSGAGELASFQFSVRFTRDGRDITAGQTGYKVGGQSRNLVPTRAGYVLNLRAGETAVFDLLPPGTGYQVTEWDYSQNGYGTSYRVDGNANVAGRSAAGQLPADVTFVNERTAPPPPVTEEEDPDPPPPPVVTVVTPWPPPPPAPVVPPVEPIPEEPDPLPPPQRQVQPTQRPAQPEPTGEGAPTGPDYESIIAGGVPMAYGPGESWSLLNLMMSLTGLFAAIAVLYTVFVRRRAPKDDEAENEYDGYREDEEEQEEKPFRRRSPVLKIVAILTGIIPGILFLLLENIALPVTWVNEWTLLIGLFFLIHVALLLVQVAVKRKVKSDKDEQEKRPAEA